MFSVIFPGQGSQIVGMSSELYSTYSLFKRNFEEADEILKFSLSKKILEGPAEELNKTENTQPAIFLVSYSIYQLMCNKLNIRLDKAKFFAGHSLGEYTALACSGAISFADAIKILNERGKAMQTSVSENKGGMLVILGTRFDEIEKIIKENDISCYIANDNSNNQVVVSGYKEHINKFSELLLKKKIKNLKLPVSAPFHCKLMHKATEIMKDKLKNINFKDLSVPIISNVTASVVNDKNELFDLLIRQIEGRVRWRESINLMVNNGIDHFIEIGPGKVLSNLIKRFDKNLKVNAINDEKDISDLNFNDQFKK